jgi:lysophospholipase L1-like esterase
VVSVHGYLHKHARRDLPQHCAVVFFGDSDIEYWDLPGTGFPDALNLGIGGATVREAARHVAATIDAVQPKEFVVFCSGENDLEYSPKREGAPEPTEALFAHFKTVLDAVTSSAHRPQLVYVGTKPEPNSAHLYPRYKAYDSMIRQHAMALSAAARHAGTPTPLVFVDTFSLLSELWTCPKCAAPCLDPRSCGSDDDSVCGCCQCCDACVPNARLLYQDDGLHLTGHGYAHLARWVAEAMAAERAARGS